MNLDIKKGEILEYQKFTKLCQVFRTIEGNKYIIGYNEIEISKFNKHFL